MARPVVHTALTSIKVIDTSRKTQMCIIVHILHSTYGRILVYYIQAHYIIGCAKFRAVLFLTDMTSGWLRIRSL